MGVREATTKTVKVRAERPPPRRVRKGSESLPPRTPQSGGGVDPSQGRGRAGQLLPGGTDWAGRGHKGGEKGQLWAEGSPAAGGGQWAVELRPGMRSGSWDSGHRLGKPQSWRVPSASPLDPDGRPAGVGAGVDERREGAGPRTVPR